mgnify:FL=1
MNNPQATIENKNEIEESSKSKKMSEPTTKTLETKANKGEDAPFGFIGSEEVKSKKNEDTVVKNPNPFEMQEQPGKLNLGGQSGSNFRMRQNNDLNKPVEKMKPVNDSDIGNLELGGKKAGAEAGKSNLEINDPFADVGDASKINFSEKKGLFSSKPDESRKDAPSQKQSEKSQFNWQSGNKKDVESSDKVFKFGEDEEKGSLLAGNFDKKSFASGNEGSKPIEIGVKKPKMKMNVGQKDSLGQKVIYYFPSRRINSFIRMQRQRKTMSSLMDWTCNGSHR